MRRHFFSATLVAVWISGRHSLQMPRVVPDQKEKFENDELFRKLSIESEVDGIFIHDHTIVKPILADQ